MQKNSIVTDIKLAVAYAGIDAKESEAMQKVCKQYKFASSEYYLELAKNSLAIKKQVFPDLKELNQSNVSTSDYLCEEKYTKLNGLIHKYPYCALITVTDNCFMLCRHCTRKRYHLVSREPAPINLDEIYDYITAHEEITDILISGGDPLTLDTSRIIAILNKFANINHIKTMRIGTRAPVTFPERIDEELVSALSKFKNLWINTQFNHYEEITEKSAAACAKLTNAGIPLGSQTVLLKGVNDDVNVLKKLFTELIAIRVRPYYLYQCDYSQGITHFVTDIGKTIEIYSQLRGHIPGYAIPQLIIDTAEEKIPLQPCPKIVCKGLGAKIYYNGKVIYYP